MNESSHYSILTHLQGARAIPLGTRACVCFVCVSCVERIDSARSHHGVPRKEGCAEGDGAAHQPHLPVLAERKTRPSLLRHIHVCLSSFAVRSVAPPQCAAMWRQLTKCTLSLPPQRARVCIWLYEKSDMRIEGRIIVRGTRHAMSLACSDCGWYISVQSACVRGPKFAAFSLSPVVLTPHAIIPPPYLCKGI